MSENSNILENAREVLNDLLEKIETNIADSGRKLLLHIFI